MLNNYKVSKIASPIFDVRGQKKSAEMNPTRNHEVAGLIPGLVQWVKL